MTVLDWVLVGVVGLIWTVAGGLLLLGKIQRGKRDGA